MRLLMFVIIGLPLFLGWIGYRLFIKKEEFKQVKDAFYTGIFCFVFMSGVIYWLM